MRSFALLALFATAMAVDHTLLKNNMKCPYNNGDRLFKERGTTLDQCKTFCDASSDCNYYSWHRGGTCMGCKHGE
jgi:hypothetical protein